MSQSILSDHKRIWDDKPVLRKIYHDFYRRIQEYAQPGQTLEIGGGTGNLKEYLPSVVSTDIVDSSWVDVVCDAQDMPFDGASFDNIVGVDVLHHIERPVRFLREASRILRKGGRLILIDPAITPMSYPFYKFIHEEPVDMSVNPLEDAALSPDRKPFDANQGIPTLLYTRYRNALAKAFPELKMVDVNYFSLWAYPLSGGFKPWSLVPSSCVDALLGLEQKIETFVGKFLAFRVVAVMEQSI